uniref:GSTd2 n=1 Tax=Liposcelis entomophila TaxID=550478 RepID=A0A1J0F4S3_9NEOP|nr:GSTd2 [Liposcelis entomophila]
MDKVEIHGFVASPPTRAVMMVCELIGVPYEMKYLEPLNKTPEFKKFNPEMTIPVLVDDGFVLIESRAIIQYLMDKYAKDDSLYPKDLKTRAVINARLNFDCGTLWPKLVAAYRPTFFGGKITDEELQIVKDTVSIVEEFLTRDKFLAGPKMTIADISFSTTLSCLLEFGFDITPYPKVTAWLAECNKVTVINKLNQEGINAFRQRLAEFQKKSQNQ